MANSCSVKKTVPAYSGSTALILSDNLVGSTPNLKELLVQGQEPLGNLICL
jgi:hypothetical protein